MNDARRFDHYLGFWNGFLGFSDTRSKEPSDPKVAKAKETLRRLARRQRPAR